MSMDFKSLQDEVLRRSVRSQSGNTFTTAVKNIINTSLFRINREAPWRPMRRKSSFTTISTYTKGTTASVTSNSNLAFINLGTSRLVNGNFETWSLGGALAPDSWTLAPSYGSVAQESTIVKSGTYSMRLYNDSGWFGGYIAQYNQNVGVTLGMPYWIGKSVTFGCWVYCTTANVAYLQLDDGIGTVSTYHTGDGTWQWLSVTKTIRATAPRLYTTCMIVGGSSVYAYYDGAVLIEGSLFSDGIEVGRRIKFDTSATYYYIDTIPSGVAVTVKPDYSGVTNTATNYSILPQETYNLPIQAGHRVFLWHEDFGFPFLVRYIPDQSFFEMAYYLTIVNVPTHYRMWGEDMVIKQIRAPSTISVSSSDSTDTAIPVTVFGNVSGYPDYEVITTNSSNGTTAVTGSNLFSSVERITKSGSTNGRITVTGDSGSTTLAVIPHGNTTSGIVYRKASLYPLPRRPFTMFVQYYKDPYALVNDGDVHELGQEFDEAIILLSTAKMKAEENQAESDRFMLLFKDELAVLRRTNCDKIDWVAKMRHPWQSNSALLVHPNLLFGQVGANFGPSSRR
jgi:hypothetical protein